MVPYLVQYKWYNNKLVLIFSIILLILLKGYFIGKAQENPEKDSIKFLINQIGYLPSTNNEAFCSLIPEKHTQASIRTATGTYEGFSRADFFLKKTYTYSGKHWSEIGLFPNKGENGFCYLDLTGSKGNVLGRTNPFFIGWMVYHKLAIASIKAFYYQRASMPLLLPYAEKWARKLGHPDTVVYIHASAASKQRPEGTVVRSERGWYDAGDYNKYVVNSGISVGTLLSAYEDYPLYYDSLKTNIPESGNGVPDILNESLYNIRWMLTMQDPNDGGVYHKCTNAEFDPMIMPEFATKKRYLVQKSTAAALDFAAVMAQSARIFSHFKKSFPGLSDSCFQASQKAWTWANKNPNQLYDQNKMNQTYSPAIHTGEYGDASLQDEFFWAASELYITDNSFGISKGLEILENNLVKARDQTSIPSWSRVGMLGYYSLMRFRKSLPKTSFIPYDTIQKKILVLAKKLMDSSYNNGVCGSLMGTSQGDFVWGSNAIAANQGILMLNAYKLSPNIRFLEAALSNLNYLLGTNPTGYSFVTGFGTRSPMHPHHRPSISDGIMDPIPGLLVGGPNPGRQDGKIYPYTDPETSYTDQDGAYASNEIAINWNAPFVYLVNGLVFLRDDLVDWKALHTQ